VSTQNPPAPVVEDRDDELNEDRDAVQVAPSPQPEMEVEQEVNDLNDDVD
jgi:hypothetical protein